MRPFILLSTLLPFLVTAIPLSKDIRSLDNSINLRNAEPEAEPETLPSPALKLRQSSSTTRNDLENGPCKNVTVIFARGTSEPGNVGSSVGPPLFNALGNLIGNDNVAAQGVDYPATVAGYLAGGDPSGGTQLANLVNLAISKCPNTKIALGGYSQGAQEVYLGTAQLTPAAANRISAVVLFGNPNGNKPVPNIPSSKVKVYCHTGDSICQGQPIVTPAHLNYGMDTPDAAKFIVAHL